MKCPVFDNSKKDDTMEKTFAVAQESKVLHLKVSPIKETSPTKPQSSSKELTTVFLSAKNNTSTVHNKENNSRRDPGTLDDCLEDSGYLSLQNSRVDFNVEFEDAHTLRKSTEELYSATTHQENTILSDQSPSKCQGKAKASHPLLLDIAATPVDCSKKKTTAALSSTPSNKHDNNLPILKFQQDVCEELAKNFKKNKKYDWSIIQEVANEHLLDRVIGRHMGLEYVDVFTHLLSRNMKRILNDILGLLGDLDLISCKKVSKTWRKIICEDKAAVTRCQLAEQQLRESSSSLRSCGLTRDVAVSRVVLSCVQTLASSSTPSSSSFNQSSRNIKRTATSQKGSSSQCSRFNEFAQAASRLKQHESLRPCRRCGSPAIHLPEVQRATCTRTSCLFDFCTCCQEASHGSTPCRTVTPKSHFTSCKTSPILPGSSARSKKNLRRL